jgi:hypothetical protein
VVLLSSYVLEMNLLHKCPKEKAAYKPVFLPPMKHQEKYISISSGGE